MFGILDSRFLAGPKYLFLLSLFLLGSSCEEPGKHSLETSEKVTQAINRSINIADSGYNYRSKRYLDSVFAVIRPTRFADRFRYLMFCFDMYNRNLRKYDIADRYADSLLMLFNEKNIRHYPSFFALANFAKGDVLFIRGDYDEAYTYFFQVKSMLKNEIDSCVMNDFSYRLGMILYRQESYLDAVKYFKECYAEAGHCSDDFPAFYRRQEVLDNIGLCYYNIRQYDSAKLYYQKALAFIQEHNGRFNRSIVLYDAARAVVYGNFASLYYKTGQVDSTEIFLKKSIAIARKTGHEPVDALLTNIKLAGLYLEKDQLQDLTALLPVIKTTLDTIADKSAQLGWHSLMWQYYRRTNQISQAFDELLSYTHLKDSLTKKSRELQRTDIHERIKNIDKQYQISILERDNLIKRNYLIITVIGGILLLVIALLAYQNWRKSKRNVLTLIQLNNRINEQKDKLKVTSQEKDRIMRAVAHDIRNPIAAISALTDLLMVDSNDFNEDQNYLLELIKNACVDTLSLSTEILDATQSMIPETMERQWVNINELVTNCADLLRFKAGEKNQQLAVHVKSQPVTLYINREKIWRVLNNLIINAIKFSPSGAPITIIVQTRDMVYISVKDEGIGIPDKIKDSVFDMFTEAKRVGTAGEKPFGMGLSISKQIVEAHNGKIWFEKGKDKGTVFCVALPLQNNLRISSQDPTPLDT